MGGDGERVIIALNRIDDVFTKFPQPSLSWLSREERLRYKSFTSGTRQQQFLCGRFLARQAISHMHGDAWYAYYLSAPEGEAPRLIGQAELAGLNTLSISISHTDGWVACALSFKPVGVDIQSRKKQRDILGLSQMIKFDLLQVLDPSATDQSQIFYAQWGLREAWIKQSDSVMKSATIPRFVAGKNAGDGFDGLVSDTGDATLAVYPASLETIEMAKESIHVDNWTHWHPLPATIVRTPL